MSFRGHAGHVGHAGHTVFAGHQGTRGTRGPHVSAGHAHSRARSPNSSTQNDFLNLVACFFTDLKQEELLQILSKIEKDLGRDEDQRGYSNRVIDIDLLLFGNKISYERDKFLPHKNIENCRFVLEPLAELAGDAIHPVHNKSFKQMLIELKD